MAADFVSLKLQDAHLVLCHEARIIESKSGTVTPTGHIERASESVICQNGAGVSLGLTAIVEADSDNSRDPLPSNLTFESGH